MARSPTARCPACGERPGPPPLAVEAASAILLAVLTARVHPFLVLAVACWLALCAVPLALAGAALLLIAASAASGNWAAMARAALGAAALSGFLLLLTLISPSGMGLGDVKAATALGLLLAWRGWPTLLAGSFAGFLLAALYGAALLITGHATRKHQIPLGSFMIAGTFLAILALGT